MPTSPPPSPLRPAAATTSVRVLGIDPGTLRLGYGVVECGGAGRLAYVECGVLSAPASASRTARLAIIGDHLRDLIDELAPDAVAIEEAFYGPNAQSTIALGEARGVALYLASCAGLPIAGYPPASVKLALTGHGRADKAQVGFMVRAVLSLKRVPEPDAADALAIAICHARNGLAGAKPAAGAGRSTAARPRPGSKLARVAGGKS